MPRGQIRTVYPTNSHIISSLESGSNYSYDDESGFDSESDLAQPYQNQLRSSFSDRIDAFLKGIRHSTTTQIPHMKTKRAAPFNIIQINLQHSKTGSYHLLKKMSKLSPSIAIVQEPWLVNESICGLSGLVLHSQPRARAAVVHTRGLTVWDLPTMSDRDTVTCLWSTSSNYSQIKEIAIISSYWDITNAEPPSTLLRALEYCEMNNLEYICGIDTNAHSSMWGCPHTDNRGSLMEEIIIGSNALLLNKGSTPTFVAGVGSSIIDITFCSPSIAPLVTNWQVQQDCSYSDHKYIRTKLNVGYIPPVRVRPLKRCQWPIFESRLAQPYLPPLFWTNTTIETEVQKAYDLINSSLDEACPKIIVRPRINNHWWTQDLEVSSRKT